MEPGPKDRNRPWEPRLVSTSRAMKLYVSIRPTVVVLARDENHARVLMRERGIKTRRIVLTEADASLPGVIIPPPKEQYAPQPRRPRGGSA